MTLVKKVQDEADEIKAKPWYHLAVTIVLAVAFIILMIILVRGCGKGNEHKPDSKTVGKIGQKENNNFQKDDKLLKFYAVAYDSVLRENGILKQQQVVLTTSLHKTENRVIELVNRGRSVKTERDTTPYSLNCDTLSTQVGVLIQKSDELQHQNKLIEANRDAAIANRDSVVAVAMNARASLKLSLDSTITIFNSTYTDYSKLVRKNKRERTLSRVLAGSTLILGTLLYLKK